MLEVKNLKKYFKVNSGLLHAVDGVSFKLDEGKTLGVVGESGCGKSTLGRVILHLHDSTDGQILYRGKDITNVPRSELSRLRHEMQIIFQDPYSSLNPRMTVFQTIAEPMEIVGKFSSDELYYVLGPSSDFLYWNGTAAYKQHAEKNGQQRYDFWKEQCQDIC